MTVLDDVLDGYISVDAARDVYGVVLEGQPLRVNDNKTAAARGG